MYSQTNFTHPYRPIIWSIAGSDCSGGAGIQADIKTAQNLNCEICTLITANTVQNSKEVLAIHPTDRQVLQASWACLMADKPPSAIKIGLLANNHQLAWLCEILTELKQQRPQCMVVFDPVLKATVGQQLQTETLETSLLIRLLKQVDVITPNQPEAEKLYKLFTHHKAVNSEAENHDVAQVYCSCSNHCLGP